MAHNLNTFYADTGICVHNIFYDKLICICKSKKVTVSTESDRRRVTFMDKF